jgi:Spy/CpxP family protein refolding chaperone
MKNTWLRLTAVTAIAGGMLLAVAQEVPGQPAPPAAQQHLRAHRRAARIAQYLNLTPAQQAQAKAEFQAARQSAQPIRQQLKQVRQGMFQAIQANDTAKIDQLSAQTANLKGQMAAMRNEAIAKIYSSLTPEQRAKADQLPAHIRQMRQQRMQNRQNPSNG